MTVCSDSVSWMEVPAFGTLKKSTTVGGCRPYNAWNGEVPIAEWYVVLCQSSAK